MLTVFSILGQQLFSGVLHSRCRLTPYPVRLGECSSVYEDCWPQYLSNVSSSPEDWACLLEEGGGGAVENDDSSWTRRSDSPWFEAQVCAM
ncbi:unnamed protein product [Discosporangium mesarthrocarpum]